MRHFSSHLLLTHGATMFLSCPKILHLPPLLSTVRSWSLSWTQASPAALQLHLVLAFDCALNSVNEESRSTALSGSLICPDSALYQSGPSQFLSSLSVAFLFSFCMWGVWIRGLACIQQMLYHWVMLPTQFKGVRNNTEQSLTWPVCHGLAFVNKNLYFKPRKF